MTFNEEDLAELLETTVAKFRAWTHAFMPDYEIVDVSGDIQLGIYTDGDEGVLVVKNHSEMFEYEGFAVSLKEGCNYCDVAADDFMSMLDALYRGDS